MTLAAFKILRIPEQRQGQGVVLPAWYYGLSYIDWERGERIYHPMPLNFIVHAWMNVSHFWNRMRTGRSYVDEEVCRWVAKHAMKMDREKWHLQDELRLANATVLELKKVCAQYYKDGNETIARMEEDTAYIKRLESRIAELSAKK